MEKPLVKYNYRLRNILVIIYWAMTFSSSIFTLTYFDSSINFVLLFTVSIIVIVLIRPFKLMTSHIYEDMLVFKEIGLTYPMIYVFGVAFENIADITVNNKILTLKQIVIKKKNGEIVRRLISLSQSELSELSKILYEKVNHTNS